MKLKKRKNLQHRVIRLKTLKLAYKKKFSYPTPKSGITQALLNKIIRIIYRYDRSNKKILFVESPEQFKKTLHNTKHTLISRLILNEIWSNETKIVKTEIPKSIYKLSLKLKKKPDLILIYNKTNDTSVLKKSYLKNIPAIVINEEQRIKNTKTIQSSRLNYSFSIEKTESTSIFFSLVKSILEKDKN